MQAAGMISRVQKYKKMPYNFILFEKIDIALINRNIFTTAKVTGKTADNSMEGYSAWTKATITNQSNTL